MSQDWSDEELLAAVRAYKEMAGLAAAGQPYTKISYYRDLASRFDRTAKSFEFRMQNISAVLYGIGQGWMDGLKPAVNVGADVESRILALLQQEAKQPLWASAPSAITKVKWSAMREWLIKLAQSHSRVTYSQMMQLFELDLPSLQQAMAVLGHALVDLKEPIITALIVEDASARCSAEWCATFAIDDDESERQRLYQFWATTDAPRAKEVPSSDAKVRAVKFAIVASRPEQAAFRRAVFERCEGRCVISGCDVANALDAAHKHGRHWQHGHNKGSDGFLLRKDLHALYDKDLLKITKAGVVELAPELMAHYQAFVGRVVV